MQNHLKSLLRFLFRVMSKTDVKILAVVHRLVSQSKDIWDRRSKKRMPPDDIWSPGQSSSPQHFRKHLLDVNLWVTGRLLEERRIDVALAGFGGLRGQSEAMKPLVKGYFGALMRQGTKSAHAVRIASDGKNRVGKTS